MLDKGKISAEELATQAADTERPGGPAFKGLVYGVISATAYAATNIGLRDVSRPSDFDWAIWVSCLKAVPTTLVAYMLLVHRGAIGLPVLPERKVWLPLIATGLMMHFGGNVSFQWALGYAGLAVVVPLCFAALILTGAAMGRIFLGEPVTPRAALAIAVLVSSIILLSVGTDEAAHTLDAAAVPIVAVIVVACISGIAYGAGSVALRRLVTNEIPVAQMLAVIGTTGVLSLGLISLIRMGPSRLLETSTHDLEVMMLAGGFNAVAFFALTASLKYISVVRANLLNSTQIALSSAAGVLMFAEPATGWMLIGTAMTISGLILLETGHIRRTPPLTDLERE